MKRWMIGVWVTLVMAFPLKAMEHFQQIGWIDSSSQVHEIVQYPQLVEQAYRQNSDQMIWFDLQQSTKLEFQLEVIQQAQFSPLFSRQLSYLAFFRKSNRWHEYDILATDTLLLYLSYAEHARSQGEDWFFGASLNAALPQLSSDAWLAFQSAVINQQLAELIEAYTPDSEGYQKLVDSYLDLLKYQKIDVPKYTQEGLKRVGDTLTDRDVLLERMAMVGVNLDEVRRDVSWYDVTLEPAIKRFQALHGLTQDGIIGSETIGWLNRPIESRMTTLALNAERMRMWPAQRDTLILVNVPSFDMHYWHAGQTVFESKVIVGKTKRPTPVMQTRLDSLIFNPTWNIPWKIMVEDIIPQVKRDPEYLTKHNIQIIPKWGSSETILASEIDWQNLRPKSFPYRMRQMSGSYNALGLYKFNTPNARAIYLHDTPSKGLFSQTSRAFSSGCIRVEHADTFANLLLAQQGMSINDVDRSEWVSNKAVALRTRIPVYIIYQTAWYEEGIVHYRDDIYRLDKSSYTKS